MLATNSLGLTAAEKTPAERESPYDLFIHSTYLVLMDRQSRMRRFFKRRARGLIFSRLKREILQAVKELQRES